jgi:hypothetical protein
MLNDTCAWRAENNVWPGPFSSLLFSPLLRSLFPLLSSPSHVAGARPAAGPCAAAGACAHRPAGPWARPGTGSRGATGMPPPPPFPSSPEAAPPLRALEGRAASARTGPRLSARCGFAGALVLFSAPRPRAARPGVEVHGAAARPEERSCQPATRACPVSTGGGTRRV